MQQRDTDQRRAIRRVFERTDRPLSTGEVLAAAQALRPRTGIATVYRTLKLLLEQGWLTTIRLPGEPPRYEAAGKPHHHHFHCTACGRAFEVRGSDASLESLVPPGFVLERHDIALHGRCRSCAEGQFVPSARVLSASP